MIGTAAAPTSSNGASTGAGSSMPVSATTSPSTEPMMSGLRTGWLRMRPSETLPEVVTSSTVSAIGANTISCSRITGADAAASPTT